MRYPQLELGTEATTFETGGEETASQIKQTANSIDLSITNMQTGLETAGVHLDGQNSTIKLKANKMNFYDASGTNLNPKIWIDPTTGTLHSVDGDFSGSVTALKLFRPACQWWGMVNYHNFDNNDGMGEWFYVVDRAKFVTFVEEGGATVPSEEEFPGGYVTFREIVGWGYGGPYAGAAELNTFASDLISIQYAAGDTLFCIPCSYNSQTVYVCGDGFYKDSESGGQTTRKYLVALPRPEDFQGMVVHVENQMTSTPTTVFVMEAGNRNLFMLNGLALFGIASDTPMSDINLPAGDSRDFMSVALTQSNVTTWYWLAL